MAGSKCSRGVFLCCSYDPRFDFRPLGTLALDSSSRPPPVSSCPGILLSWDLGSFWKNYPFHIHDDDSQYHPGYHFIGFKPPRIRASRCRGGVVTPNGVLTCSKCCDLRVDVDVVKDRARRDFSGVRTDDDLTPSQLRDKLAAAKESVNTLKLKVYIVSVCL